MEGEQVRCCTLAVWRCAASGHSRDISTDPSPPTPPLCPPQVPPLPPPAAGGGTPPAPGTFDMRLHAAAASGDLARIRALLDQGLPPDQPDLSRSPSHGETPLMAAAEVGGHRRSPLCRLRLRLGGAHGTCHACHAYTPPLTPRTAPQHPLAVAMLLKAGADANRRSLAGGWTALHFCCEHSASLEVARRLLAGERRNGPGCPLLQGCVQRTSHELCGIPCCSGG